MKKNLSRLILFRLFGWEIKGNKDLSKSSVKKVVIISAPHTHWYDFFLGLLIKGSIGFESYFLAKKELFFFPVSSILKFFGGIPVNRSSKSNLVQAIADLFKVNNEFRVSLSPEGTRSKVDKFKTGFYYIAKTAKVPIIMITMDYKNRSSLISDPFFTTDDIVKDFNYIEGFFDGVVGKIEKYSFNK